MMPNNPCSTAWLWIFNSVACPVSNLANAWLVTSQTPPLIFLTAHENWEKLKQSISTPYVALLRKNDPGEAVINAIESSIRHIDHDRRITAGSCNNKTGKTLY
jgi:hypothetical protein